MVRQVDQAGGVLVGRWERDLPREGIMTWPNGDCYDGWWSASECHHTAGDQTLPLWRTLDGPLEGTWRASEIAPCHAMSCHVMAGS